MDCFNGRVESKIPETGKDQGIIQSTQMQSLYETGLLRPCL